MANLLALKPALSNPPTTRQGVTLTPLADGHILQVASRKGVDLTPSELEALGDGLPHAVRPLGPGQWLIVGEKSLSPQGLCSKAEPFGDRADVVDLSHGRVRIKLEGPGCMDLIASGSGVDLRQRSFHIGVTVSTLFRHITIVLTRTGPTAFEVLVARSFATALWDELVGH